MSIEQLKNVRELLLLPAHWTTGKFAADETGREAPPRAGYASCWCLRGAIQKIYGTNDDWNTPEYPFIQAAVAEHASFPNQSIANFNDTHSHEEVIAVIDRAIELAEQAHALR